ncbi:hypothetical protein ACW7G2_10425 [Luteimonas sp. A277]
MADLGPLLLRLQDPGQASLDEAEARGTLDADYRGPVMAGDLDAITSPAHVLIIDGILDVGRRLAIAEAERALQHFGKIVPDI